MCRFAFTTAECCLIFDRPTGAKLIGFFYITLFFLGLLGPVVELNKFRVEKYNIVEEDDYDDVPAGSSSNGRTVKDHGNVFTLMEDYGHMTSYGYEVMKRDTCS